MQEVNWRTIRTVFDAALDVEVIDRNRLVEQLSRGDLPVRDTVLELLAHHEEECQPQSGSNPDTRVFQDGELIAGRFEIMKFVDRGGMGEVYEAWDRRLHLRCALKTVRPDLAATGAALERCEREIRVVRNVSHENLCRVFDFLEHTSTVAGSRTVPCLTMEFVEGISLAHKLARDGPFTCAEALPLIQQVTGGLGVLHANGIVHRDLKPSNIMLSQRRDGQTRAVLMDFGLAREVEGDLFEAAGHLNAGAPYYMAPEILRNACPNKAADIYALGLIIDEMVSSSRAFPTESLQGLCYSKLWEKPIAPSQRVAGLPQAWNDTILRCLEPEPANRFEAAEEVLASLIGDRPVADAPRAGSSSKSAARRLFLVLAAFIVFILFVGGGWAALSTPVASVSIFEIENRTSDRNLEYACRGITAELTRRMSQLGEVKVVPMHASRSGLQGADPSRFSVSGEVGTVGDRVKLVFAVRDNRNGQQLWSGSFDAKHMNDTVALQSEIATRTAAALQKRILFGTLPSLSGAAPVAAILVPFRRVFHSNSGARVANPPTLSNSALDKYMRGRELIRQDPPEVIQSGIDLLNSAVAEDPKFALAYAALALAHIGFTGYAYDQTRQMIELAHRYALDAISIDPELAESHEALGMVLERNWSWASAETQYVEALRLKPALASARRRYGRLLVQTGRLDEGLLQIRQSAKDDPYDASAPNNLGLSLFLASRFTEALAVLEAAANRADNLGGAHNLADVHAQLAILSSGSVRDEHLRKALELADRVTALENGMHADPRIKTPWGDKMHAHFYSIQGNHAAAQPYLMRMVTDMKNGVTSPANLAMVLTAQGRKQEALDLLDESVVRRDPYVPLVKVMPFFSPLRNEPRFQKLLRTVGIS